jgi:hypothetical protein
MRTFIFSLAGFVLLAAAARGDPPDCTARPLIQHTPSFLGNTLTLDIVNAPADSAVVLFHGPTARRTQTPVGLLELERARLNIVAFGRTGPDGSWSIHINVPDEPVLAELPARFQALIAGDVYVGGAVLSEAAHMRLTGPRVYAAWSGRESGPAGPENAGLAVVSALTNDVVAEVDLGAIDADVRALGDGKPVFCPSCTIGAFVPGADGLAVFDRHFPTLYALVPFEHPSRTVVLHPDEPVAFVLETGYRTRPQPDGSATLHKVSLCGQISDEQLELPYLAPGLWTTNDAGTKAFVAELGENGRTAIRRIDLIGFADLGAVEVGVEDSDEFTELLWAFNRLYVATRSPDDPYAARAQLSSVNWWGGTPTVEVSTDWQWICSLEAVREAGTLVAYDFQPYVPAGSLHTMRPGAMDLKGTLGLPWVYLHCDALVEQDCGLWVLDASNNEPPTATDPGCVFHLGLDGERWWQHPTVYPLIGPVSMDLVRDAYSDVVALAGIGYDPPVDLEPSLILIDKSGAEPVETTIPLGFQPTMLHGVPVP